MILTDYYDLPMDMAKWSNDEKKLYHNSCKNISELKGRIVEDVPELYNTVRKSNVIRLLDDDPDKAIIIGLSNKLSYESKRFHITYLMQYTEKLDPQVIGYVYNGIIGGE